MENSTHTNFLRFLAEQEKLTEGRLAGLNSILDSGVGLQCPEHILDALDHLRQNAEDDLSNILHIQSTFPSSVSRAAPVRHPVMSPMGREEPAPGLGHLEQVVEGHSGGQLSLADDDMFTLDGVSARRSPAALSPSDEDREEADSEPDEGIHIPGKFRQNKPLEVAASLPVGIPWPAQLTAAGGGDRQRTAGVKGQPSEALEARGSERPSDIAASIQALAKSVHTSSIFGDNVFGDLPRPRVNTFSKD